MSSLRGYSYLRKECRCGCGCGREERKERRQVHIYPPLFALFKCSLETRDTVTRLFCPTAPSSYAHLQVLPALLGPLPDLGKCTHPPYLLKCNMWGVSLFGWLGAFLLVGENATRRGVSLSDRRSQGESCAWPVQECAFGKRA